MPQQALALANGRLSLEMSRLIAGELSPSSETAAVSPADGNRSASATVKPSNGAFVKTALERALGRVPTQQELAQSVKYLEEQAALYRSGNLTPFRTGPEAVIKPSSDPDQRARESLVHVLLNHNDFVTIR